MNRITALFVLFALLTGITPFTVAVAASDVDETVAGRLGGTLQSFVERFGEPVSINQSAGAAFNADGFGRIFVQVDHVQGTADADGRARSIVAGAPRPADISATEPDDRDWPVPDAVKRAKSLLPMDAELSEPVRSDLDGQLSATCRSDALQELFGVLTLGECRVSFVQPTPESVSFFTVALITGSGDVESSPPSANPCEGMIGWIHRAGERLTQSQALLESVASTDDSDPAAPESLRDIAMSFGQLAAEQRGDAPALAATNTGETLVDAFDAYAVAVTAAADGLETQDAELIQQAVAGIKQANALVGEVVGALDEIAVTCGLVVDTLQESTPDAR